jgi:hypothetical protein
MPRRRFSSCPGRQTAGTLPGQRAQPSPPNAILCLMWMGTCLLRRVRGEIMGSQQCSIVRKSQSLLIMIDPLISTRTRMCKGGVMRTVSPWVST